MASEIHYQAALLGQASPGGRLDPPLLMGLDEVTQICPVPLPVWLADSGGKGIQVFAVAHGEAQLAGRWGEHGKQAILDTCSVKVFLPGITDTATLDAASKLCGQAAFKEHGQDHHSRHDVATPDMIRQLPPGFALVIRGGCSPVIARLPRAWNDRAYRRARRHGRATATARPAQAAGLGRPAPGASRRSARTRCRPTRSRPAPPSRGPDMTGDPIPAVLLQLSEHAQRLASLDQREAAHYHAAQQRLGELAELITALGGTLQDQSAVLARLDDLAERIPVPAAPDG